MKHEKRQLDGWRILLEYFRLGADGGDFGRFDVDEAAVLATVLEADNAVNFGEEGVVLAAAYVQAGLERSAALPHDDAAAEDGLSAEDFNAEPLRV